MLRGQFLLNAILLDEIFDVSEIGIVRAWPYWYNNDFANAYTAAYRDTVMLNRVDGLKMGYLFGIFSASMLRYGQSHGSGRRRGVSAEHSIAAVYGIARQA